MTIEKARSINTTEVRLAEEKLQKYSVETTKPGMRRLFFGDKFHDLSNVQHQLREFDIVPTKTLHSVARDFTLHVIQDASELFRPGEHKNVNPENCLKDLEFAMVLLDREKLNTNGFIGALKSFLQNLSDRIKGKHMSESVLYETYKQFALKVDEVQKSSGSETNYTEWMKFFNNLGVVFTKAGYKVKNEGSIAKVIGDKALQKKGASVQDQAPTYPERIVKSKRVRKYPVGE